MHYSSRAFVKDYTDKNMRSILPKDKSVDPDNLGFKADLSETDKIKIRKMYKCTPYGDYKVKCRWVKVLDNQVKLKKDRNEKLG